MPMTVRDMLKRLRADGWSVVRQKGSHRQMQHPTKPGSVSVAGNEQSTLKPGTEHTILKDAGLK